MTSKGSQPCVGHAIDWQSQRRHAAPCDHRWTPRSEFRNAAFNRHVLGLAEQAGVTAHVRTHRIPLFSDKTHGPSLFWHLYKNNLMSRFVPSMGMPDPSDSSQGRQPVLIS
jgi:hypothetical protein